MKLFVYGTLKKGGALHTGVETSIVEDSIQGKMYSLGAFPAVRLDREGTVYGEIHEIDDRFLEVYDRIEGEGRLYRRLNVTTNSGEEVQVYEFMQELPEESVIESGTWINKTGGWK